MKTITLKLEGDADITVTLDGKGGGTIESTLGIPEDSEEFDLEYDQAYNNAIDGIESLVLAHACAGVNVEDPRYLQGLQTAVHAVANNT